MSEWCEKCLVKENYFRMKSFSEAITKSRSIFVRSEAKSPSGQRLTSGTLRFCC